MRFAKNPGGDSCGHIMVAMQNVPFDRLVFCGFGATEIDKLLENTQNLLDLKMMAVPPEHME